MTIFYTSINDEISFPFLYVQIIINFLLNMFFVLSSVQILSNFTYA